MKRDMLSIRKNQHKLVDEILENGHDFRLHEEIELGAMGWQNQSPTGDYPSSAQAIKNHLLHMIHTKEKGGSIGCFPDNGHCILDVHSGKYYSFNVDPALVRRKINEKKKDTDYPVM